MRFIESILFKDEKYHHLALHQERVDRTFKSFGAASKSPDLLRILPKFNYKEKHKVRVIYQLSSKGFSYKIDHGAYSPRTIKTLEVRSVAPFDYSFKYENREKINTLFQQSTADDIIILVGNNITDSSYANLVFWDGSDWVTPDEPLLNGVKRQLLLSEKRIIKAPIRISDLGAFEKVSLINAMLDLGEIEVPMSQVLK